MPKIVDDPATTAAKAALRKAAGHRLTLSRRLINSNRTWVAESFGVRHQRWHMWEHGVHDMDNLVMQEFCERYGFTADWLVLGRYETLPPNIQTLMMTAFPDEIEPYLRKLANLTALKPGVDTPERPLPPDLSPGDLSPDQQSTRKKRWRGYRTRSATN